MSYRTIPTRLTSLLRDRWQMSNDPVGYARRIGVTLGDRCMIYGLQRSTFGSEPYLVTLGDHVHMASEVLFITHDGMVRLFVDEHPDLDVIAPITIGNDVMIGARAMFMPGVTIGDYCAIGAGAVVARDVPSGSVVAGVPAKVIMTTDEYKVRALAKGLPFRTLPPDEKRAAIKAHFGVR